MTQINDVGTFCNDQPVVMTLFSRNFGSLLKSSGDSSGCDAICSLMAKTAKIIFEETRAMFAHVSFDQMIFLLDTTTPPRFRKDELRGVAALSGFSSSALMATLMKTPLWRFLENLPYFETRSEQVSPDAAAALVFRAVGRSTSRALDQICSRYFPERCTQQMTIRARIDLLASAGIDFNRCFSREYRNGVFFKRYFVTRVLTPDEHERRIIVPASGGCFTVPEIRQLSTVALERVEDMTRFVFSEKDAFHEPIPRFGSV
jgi:hypothetical protein